MTTTLISFEELAQQAEISGLRPRIQRGDVFWVENQALQNEAFRLTDRTVGNFHAVVVIWVRDGYASVRVMTSKVKGFRQRGLLYTAGADVRLKGISLILLKKCFHQRIQVEELRQARYLGNVGSEVLRRIHSQEQALKRRNGHASSPALKQVEPGSGPHWETTREEELVDHLLSSLGLKLA